MSVPVDYSLFAGNLAPAFPLWFIIPFFIYILSMPIGAMALATRHPMRGDPLWMQMFVVLGILAQMTFVPLGATVWIGLLMVLDGLIGAHWWQVVCLHMLLFGSFFGSCYLWPGRFIRP
jgi:hypothetical protein